MIGSVFIGSVHNRLGAAGDGTHLCDFVARTTDVGAEPANLNYWAHWIGELTDDQTDDTFMIARDTRSWSGVRLFHPRLRDASPKRP